MLVVSDRFSEVNIHGLYKVYSQSLDQEDWKRVSSFLDDLRLFFKMEGVFLAQWYLGECPVAAMRVESYCDGYLITCLETNPQYRRNGYASQLLCAVMEYRPGIYYSHVDRRNKASIALHRKLGFEVILDYAVHVDGSVYTNSVTLKR